MPTTIKNRPPRTLMEVYNLLPEGTLVQLIENRLIMSPVPLDVHQKILNEISLTFFSFVKKNDLLLMKFSDLTLIKCIVTGCLL